MEATWPGPASRLWRKTRKQTCVSSAPASRASPLFASDLLPWQPTADHTQAYELVKRGKKVVLLEARQVLSGETGRTSGHLSNQLEDTYPNLAKKHGISAVQLAAHSHTWAMDRVGEIAREHNIDCEYRVLPACKISQHINGTKEHENDMKEIQEDVEISCKIGVQAVFDPDLKVRGWDGPVDQRGGGKYEHQATFHPTKYLNGVLEYLKGQPNFSCFTDSRVISVEEEGHEVLGLGHEVLGLGHKSCVVSTKEGHKVKCEFAVEATDVPLQKLAIIVQMTWFRTYCIAIKVPKGSVEDALIYDSNDPYTYARLTECDEKDDYMVVGGCDHKVGQELGELRFDELERVHRAVDARQVPAGGRCRLSLEWAGVQFSGLAGHRGTQPGAEEGVCGDG